MRRRKPWRERRRVAIGLTPLIDVVFILLIFFMVVSSFAERRTLSLNEPARAGSGGGMTGNVLVRLTPDGADVQGRPVPEGALRDRVARALDKAPDASVLLQPADGVDVQRTVDALTAVRALDAPVRLLAAPGEAG